MLTKILITGAGGQLGQQFLELSKSEPELVFYFFSHHDLDILDERQFSKIIKEINPDYLINCAAYTAVDKAEEEKGLCYKINTLACRSLVDVLRGTNTKIIHYSTDYVYHTYDGFPLSEESPTNPQSVYARTKLEGENFLRNSDVPSLIIRTSWVYSQYGSNFVKTMLRLSANRDDISIVSDQYGAPTFAYDLASTTLNIIKMVTKDKTKMVHFSETYNYCNEGIISWADFANVIMQEINAKTVIQPILSAQYPTLAQRPKWSVLSKHKIKNNFGIDIPHWYNALQRCLLSIKQ